VSRSSRSGLSAPAALSALPVGPRVGKNKPAGGEGSANGTAGGPDRKRWRQASVRCRYLKRFPVDVVKIDQGFVADMAHDSASSAIVAAIVDLAHVLGMTVVAEGVETADQHRVIAALGCESWQGYYFARPMSADDFDELISPAGDDRRLPLPVG
jgi:EAL domain